MPSPLLIFDGDCGFCRRWVRRWERRTGDRVRFAPFQAPGVLAAAGVPREDAERHVVLIEPGGERHDGADAVFRLLAKAPRGAVWGLVPRLAPVLAVAQAVYGVVARHRVAASRLDRLLIGKTSELPDRRAMRRLYFAGMGLVYGAAFTSLRRQVRGLYGKRGILPVGEYLDVVRESLAPAERFHYLPTYFWADASDETLEHVCRVGQVAALALGLGLSPKVSSVLALALYESLVAPGREFLSYQWDALLIEAGLLGAATAPWRSLGDPAVPSPAWTDALLHRWLVFRLYLESGLCKLQSGDEAWRDGTALRYHYETQPIPNPAAWHAHNVPAWAQKASTWASLAVELAAPALVVLPRRPRAVAFALFAGLQAAIGGTGNYGFFNLLSAVEGLWLLDDAMLPRWLRGRPPAKAPPVSPLAQVARLAVAAPLVTLATRRLLWRLRGATDRRPASVHDGDGSGFLSKLETRFRVWRAVNSYGLFAVMTKERPEIVVEGGGDGRTWRTYGFRYKIGDPMARPPVAWLHMPRLDWQMWFAALRGRPPAWFGQFLLRLLEGAPEVTALLATNPFPDAPPRYVRATLFDYRMTDRKTRRQTGAWWTRERLTTYFPVATLAT